MNRVTELAVMQLCDRHWIDTRTHPTVIMLPVGGIDALFDQARMMRRFPGEEATFLCATGRVKLVEGDVAEPVVTESEPHA